ncbi:hypothetical protein PRZ48_005463 [Zasmidium cellare]|uniref:Uncharacterized protein n=1 Tax=Zasmidium cellare TaxID=395010 RepID=A0ABR0EST5_ZASCE|nr:hypothetical protein PRZ48_005463 [Zasmidium cellare]
MEEDPFHSHAFGPSEHYVDLFHVYDNLSRTPYIPGEGIRREDPDRYWMHPIHVITPEKLMLHADWNNRKPTQFISFYGDLASARQEAQRRRGQKIVPGGLQRDPDSVRIAHVRLQREANVFFFSRDEMLEMMQCFGGNARSEMYSRSHPHECDRRFAY